jgi:hypothetical protein
MAARECVLRFLAFTLTPPEKYKAADFDAFLSDAMGALNVMPVADRDDLAARFIRALKISNSVFAGTAFRKPGLRHPVNKALFEVWTVTMDNQTDERVRLMEASRQTVAHKIQELMASDLAFLNAISQGTGDVAKVRLRFDHFRTMLQEALP